MATTVPIEIFLLAKTAPDRKEMQRWLQFKGVKNYDLPEEPVYDKEDQLVNGDDDPVTDAALLVGMAAKRCYMSFDTSQNPNLTRVRSDWNEYFDNIKKVGHGSVLEHSSFTFAIENVSRVFTGEMNRHRAGWAISEGSMRFIRFSEAVPYWEPDSIKGPEVISDGRADDLLASLESLGLLRGGAEYAGSIEQAIAAIDPTIIVTVDVKKQLTRTIFADSFDEQRRTYALLEKIWADELKPESTFKQKKELTSLFRRIIGMGCATGGVWTGNVRALRHVLTMRCDPAAEEEILHVFSRIAKMMVETEPMLFGDFAQTETGHWVPKYKKV